LFVYLRKQCEKTRQNEYSRPLLIIVFTFDAEQW